jgi:hypothetical protein
MFVCSWLAGKKVDSLLLSIIEKADYREALN